MDHILHKNMISSWYSNWMNLSLYKKYHSPVYEIYMKPITLYQSTSQLWKCVESYDGYRHNLININNQLLMTHGTATFLKLAVFPFPVQCDVQHFDIWIQWIYFCKIVIIHLCIKFTVKICQSIDVKILQALYYCDLEQQLAVF